LVDVQNNGSRLAERYFSRLGSRQAGKLRVAQQREDAPDAKIQHGCAQQYADGTERHRPLSR
jgi:hypothetical protein